MEMHPVHEKNKGFVANKLLDVLIQHTICTLYQVMMFMSDAAQDTLVDEITKQKNKIQEVRIKSNDSES
ncbi:hypothetical protein LCGC14_1750310 [marine sediment metagenome]|uniref:Uncharacterized protein n=1 Tax=marine sediment metagenome TaxID=412755 RepID=A0A0F9HRF2_9ZZZZ